MAGLLDFIQQNRARQERAEVREQQRSAITEALGREPNIPAFLPGDPGAGLLADPRDLRNQVEFAGRVAAVAPQVGGQLLNTLFSGEQQLDVTELTQAGASERLMAQIEDAQTRQSRQIAATASEGAADRRSREFVAEMQSQVSRLNTLDMIEAQRAGAAGQFPQTQVIQSPFNFQPQQVPTFGTSEYNKQQGAADSLSNLLVDVNQMIEDINTFGTEGGMPFVSNKAVAGRMASRWSGLLFRATQAREGGAPQAAELELNARSLPDPTSFLGNLAAPFRTGEREQMIAAYQAFATEVSRALLAQYRINPTLSVDLGLMDPTVLTPEAREYLESQRPDQLTLGQFGGPRQ